MKDIGLHYDKNSDWQQAMWEKLINLSRSAPVSSRPDLVRWILDIGCGSGARTKQALELFPETKKILAIDNDESMINAALLQNSDSRIEYRVLGIENIGEIQGHTADIVIAHWCLHWIKDKNRLFNDLVRCSNKGSLFLISTCERLPDLLQIIDDEIRSHLEIEEPSPFHYLNASQWNAIIQDTDSWEVAFCETESIAHEVTAGLDFLRIWFSASTGSAFYGRTLESLSSEFLDGLITLLDGKFKERQGTWTFIEDTLFLIVQRVAS